MDTALWEGRTTYIDSVFLSVSVLAMVVLLSVLSDYQVDKFVVMRIDGTHDGYIGLPALNIQPRTGSISLSTKSILGDASIRQSFGAAAKSSPAPLNEMLMLDGSVVTY